MVLVQQGNKQRNAVGHLVDDYHLELESDRIAIAGSLGWAKQKQMNPTNLIILRLVMLSIGRFFPNLIRRLLQTVLIVGKDTTPFRFERRLIWQSGHWQVEDCLTAKSWQEGNSPR